MVKFNKDFDWKRELNNIKRIFDSIDVLGVNYTEYTINCIERDNRYDLLIKIDMEKESLSLYDACPNHHEWKDTYSAKIEKKAIFDYE